MGIKAAAIGSNIHHASGGGEKNGVFTQHPETLTNDFFVNQLDIGHGVETGQCNATIYLFA